jgi:hypothetical protein
MNKRTPRVEWMIAQSDADWERLQGPPLPDCKPAAPRRRLLQRSFWSMAALFLLLMSAGDWWWRATQAHPVEVAVTATAQPEPGVVMQQDDHSTTRNPGDQSGLDWWYQQQREASGLRAAIQTADPNAHLYFELHRLGFQGDQAVAQVVTTAQNGAPAYRQIFFYRHTATGWLRTEADAALWGPERSLETPSFVFRFRQHDAPTVITVLAQMDTLYTTMRHNFGLPIGEKLVIDVRVTQSPGNALFQQHNDERFVMNDRLIVAPPSLYLAPVALTDADLLAQSIALPLLEQVLAQASEQYAVGESWQPLLAGLRLWQLWDLDMPLSAWREEVVKWIYIDLPAVGSGQSFVLPEHYTALCAAHKLWLSSPTEMKIPLVCGELDWEDFLLSPWGWHDPLTHLNQLVVPLRPGEYLEEPDSLRLVRHPGHTVALATLIEYAVATYGRERLPTLVAGLGQYDTWDTLLPAVFGTSSAQFEAGWQAYLSVHYGS